MRIITYQSRAVYKILKTKGEHKITSPEMTKTFNNFCSKTYPLNRPFEEGYEYIKNRMKKLINNEDLDDDIISPIWGWASYKSIRKLDKDNPDYYRIVLDIPDDKVLLTDFYEYENCSIGKLRAVFDTEEEVLEAEKREEELGKEYTYALYDRMLDLSNAEYVQATFWKIKKEYIVSMTKVRVKQRKIRR